MSHPGMPSAAEQQIPGPPYPPMVASLGGAPTTSIDVPLASVFLVLFIGAAAGHMTIFQLNRRKGHKFTPSALTFGFCMARIMSMILRIVWTYYRDDVQIAIAASIFVAAGVLILFLINLAFAQRIIRAACPRLGWSMGLGWSFRILYGLLPVLLVVLIVINILNFYTLDVVKKLQYRDVLLAAQTFFLFLCFLPIPLVVVALGIKWSTNQQIDSFGTGSFRTKVILLLCSSAVLTLGAGFRVGTSFLPPVSLEATPPWYFSKACFWIFNFSIEACVVYSYLIFRVDRRFYVPPNANGNYVDAAATEAREKEESISSVEAAA